MNLLISWSQQFKKSTFRCGWSSSFVVRKTSSSERQKVRTIKKTFKDGQFRVVNILTGGNIDSTVLGRTIERGLAVDGRLVKFDVSFLNNVKRWDIDKY